jgi:hypothetical protein
VTRGAPAAALLLAGLVLAGPAPRGPGSALGAEEPPLIRLSDWKLERFRYGQGDKIPKKVVALITFNNVGKQQIDGLKSRLTYYASTGEKVLTTGWQFAPFISPGKGRTLKYVEGLVPAFEAYELLVEYRAGDRQYRHTYRSPDPFSLPALWSETPVPGTSKLVLMGREVSPDPRTGRHSLYVRVRNLGEKPASGAAVILEFLGRNRRVLYSFERKLGDGTVPGGKQREYRFSVDRQVKGYAGYRVRLKVDAASSEEALSGGTFSERPELEIAHFQFRRKPKGALLIRARIRNGRKQAVTDPTVVIQLTDKSDPPKPVKKVPFQISGTLRPGQVRAFELTVPECPPFGAFSYEIEFAERSREVVFEPIIAKVASGRVGATRIDVKKGPAGELRFVARLLSRAPYEVTGVKLVISLRGGPNGKVVARCAGGLDRLAAGARARVVAELAGPPKFANFTYRVLYTEPRPAKPVIPERKKRDPG